MCSVYSYTSDSALKTEKTSQKLPVKYIAGFDRSGEDSSDTEGKERQAPSFVRSRSSKITEQLLNLRKNRRNGAGIRSSMKSSPDKSDSDYESSDSEAVSSAMPIKIAAAKKDSIEPMGKPTDLESQELDEEEAWV